MRPLGGTGRRAPGRRRSLLTRLVPLGVALAALAAFAAFIATGCGGKFALPTERRAALAVPGDQSYQVLETWDGMRDIQDLLVTQGQGSQLFLLFNHGGSTTATRGDVHGFAFSRPNSSSPPIDLGFRFGGLFNPVAMAVGGDGNAGGLPRDRVFVLDQGDTCLAKFNPDSARCGFIPIKQIQYFWHVREYGLAGGALPISSFTDTTMAFVNGVAADAQGNVYVGGIAIVFLPDQDPRLLQRVFSSRIYKYHRDPANPGAWVRDLTYQVADGQGVGFVKDPRGMAWLDGGLGGPGLYVADFGNNSGEKLDALNSSTGFFRDEADSAGSALSGPTDIAADFQGYSYVADSGNRRVLRFDPYGQYVQRVDVELDGHVHPRLQNPVAVAADDSLVYVADRTLGQIFHFKRRR